MAHTLSINVTRTKPLFLPSTYRIFQGKLLKYNAKRVKNKNKKPTLLIIKILIWPSWGYFKLNSCDLGGLKKPSEFKVFPEWQCSKQLVRNKLNPPWRSLLSSKAHRVLGKKRKRSSEQWQMVKSKDRRNRSAQTLDIITIESKYDYHV
jgi:hypothetical protein